MLSKKAGLSPKSRNQMRSKWILEIEIFCFFVCLFEMPGWFYFHFRNLLSSVTLSRTGYMYKTPSSVTAGLKALFGLQSWSCSDDKAHSFHLQYQRSSVCNTDELENFLCAASLTIIFILETQIMNSKLYQWSVLKQNPGLQVFISVSSPCQTVYVFWQA